ncbi:MAG: hypothetical protein KGV50_02485 [Gammaproteobacteria bacterium]|nr:hypothetical protein [Gammaproteobacteria bacterium]
MNAKEYNVTAEILANQVGYLELELRRHSEAIHQLEHRQKLNAEEAKFISASILRAVGQQEMTRMQLLASKKRLSNFLEHGEIDA